MAKPPEPGREQAEASATATKLRTMFPSCPVCSANIEGHSFILVASVALSRAQKPFLVQFFSAVRQRNWSQLVTFDDWDSTSDDLLAYVIRGDHAGGVMIVVKDVAEPYERDEVFLQEILTGEEMTSLTNTARAEWKPM